MGMEEKKLHEVEVETGIVMKMRDGVELQADVYTPKADGDYPVSCCVCPMTRRPLKIRP